MTRAEAKLLSRVLAEAARRRLLGRLLARSRDCRDLLNQEMVRKRDSNPTL
jgi:hypothetical protein